MNPARKAKKYWVKIVGIEAEMDVDFIAKAGEKWIYVNEDYEVYVYGNLNELVADLLEDLKPIDCNIPTLHEKCKAYEEAIEKLRAGKIKPKLVPWGEVA